MFREDNAEGERIEKLFASKLEFQYQYVAKMLGYCKGFDLVGFDKDLLNPVRYEVKYDRRSGETGNIAIEYECKGQPSGIATTTSDYWVQYVGDCFYLAKTEELKAWIREHGNECKWVGGQAKLVLVPIITQGLFQII